VRQHTSDFHDHSCGEREERRPRRIRRWRNEDGAVPHVMEVGGVADDDDFGFDTSATDRLTAQLVIVGRHRRHA
jgi:hypothetical protein